MPIQQPYLCLTWHCQHVRIPCHLQLPAAAAVAQQRKVRSSKARAVATQHAGSGAVCSASVHSRSICGTVWPDMHSTAAALVPLVLYDNSCGTDVTT